jgi:hypothetical protein
VERRELRDGLKEEEGGEGRFLKKRDEIFFAQGGTGGVALACSASRDFFVSQPILVGTGEGRLDREGAAQNKEGPTRDKERATQLYLSRPKGKERKQTGTDRQILEFLVHLEV